MLQRDTLRWRWKMLTWRLQFRNDGLGVGGRCKIVRSMQAAKDGADCSTISARIGRHMADSFHDTVFGRCSFIALESGVIRFDRGGCEFHFLLHTNF
jgi:hypothetical protein